jgi:hypothetical protein
MNDPVRAFCIQKGYAQYVVEGGLDYLMASWEKTSTRTAIGYFLGFDDFLNDMDGRRILGDVLQVATGKQTESIELRLTKAVPLGSVGLPTSAPSGQAALPQSPHR